MDYVNYSSFEFGASNSATVTSVFSKQFLIFYYNLSFIIINNLH